MHTDNKKNLGLGDSPTGLHDTSITAEAKYSINFTESEKDLL